MKPRILFFNGTLGAGGAERVMAILANHLEEKGEQVEIVLYHSDPIFYRLNDSIRVTYISKENKGKGFLHNLIWLRKYISQNADIVISFNASMNIYALLATLGKKQKIIVADRNDPRNIPKKKFLRVVRNVLYNFADGIVIQNTRNQSYFNKKIQKKSVVIYNPVEMDEYRGKALRSSKKKRVVTIGRTTPQKNQKILIEAFAKVKKKYNDYTLTIYGTGPLLEQLKGYAVELGVGDSVELPGAVQNVHDLILDAEVFVLSSNYEGMPNALIEAMVLGLPVISTKVSGATDLIVDGKNGLLVNVGSAAEIEKAILSYLENNDLKNSCAAAAVKIADELRIDYIVDQWLAFLNSVLEKGKNEI